MDTASKKIIIIGAAAATIGIIVGVLIGWYSHDPIPSYASTVDKQLKDLDVGRISKYVGEVSAEQIRNNLNFLAEKPHMATTARDVELAEHIDTLWKSQLDTSEMVRYEFLMSFPSDDQENERNVAEAYNEGGDVVFTTRTTEEVYVEYMKAPETIVPYFSAFAPAGTVRGKLVYANQGLESDFSFLADQGVNLTGTIALVKYGGNGRGAKTVNAKKYGAVGVLVYSDPEDYALDGDIGYPSDFSIPPTGVQRGSALLASGDPSTPGYPSIKSAYRIPKEGNPYFPVLPMQPIAYADAEKLIQMLAQNETLVADGWSTGLNNKIINVGPGFSDGGDLRLSVNNKLRYVESRNVIGTIRGSTEPDDWVIYGNHRDSWVYGAVDPSSGTACMLETTRIFGELMKSGWRPKRTIKFASWGAEEFGLIGSIEWGQEKANLLIDRAVAYINVDIAVFANLTFFTRASPLFTSVVKDAASEVQDPIDPSKSVLENWLDYYPGPGDDIPYIGKLYSSSDYAYFYNALGITSADLSYRGDPNERRYQISPYPTYHTAYDTFDYVDRFIDPGFTAHSTVCKVSGAMMIRLADSLTIPFDLNAMAAVIEGMAQKTGSNYLSAFDSEKLEYLEEAARYLVANASEMTQYIDQALDRKNVLEIAAVNRRLRNFEKSFIEPLALPGQLNFKHIAGSYYGYDSGAFPSIDALLSGNTASSPDIQIEAEKQLAMITYRILNAASTLNL